MTKYTVFGKSKKAKNVNDKKEQRHTLTKENFCGNFNKGLVNLILTKFSKTYTIFWVRMFQHFSNL